MVGRVNGSESARSQVSVKVGGDEGASWALETPWHSRRVLNSDGAGRGPSKAQSLLLSVERCLLYYYEIISEGPCAPTHIFL